MLYLLLFLSRFTFSLFLSNRLSPFPSFRFVRFLSPPTPPLRLPLPCCILQKRPDHHLHKLYARACTPAANARLFQRANLHSLARR